jgi:hypothetical protein
MSAAGRIVAWSFRLRHRWSSQSHRHAIARGDAEKLQRSAMSSHSKAHARTNGLRTRWACRGRPVVAADARGYAGQTDPKSCPVGGLWTACHARSADLDQTGSPACVAA